jgi:AcrR family transcriptional regulator
MRATITASQGLACHSTCCSMSLDRSTTGADIAMTDRKRQILEQAIEIISSEGYANLSMRALARASDMKLGALQYHFPTREDLLRDLAAFVGEEYARSFDALAEGRDSPGLRETVRFLFDETPADATLQADRLFPQLWAMAQVEPVMESMLDDIYRRYLDTLEERLVTEGSRAPRAEALALMSMVEGATLFMGHGRRWARDAKSVRDAVLVFIDANYTANDGGEDAASASATNRQSNRRRRAPRSK